MTEQRLHPVDNRPVDATPVCDKADFPIQLGCVVPARDARELERRARRAETDLADTLTKIKAVERDRDKWHRAWEEQRKVTGEVGCKLMTAETRIAELERELAWVRAFPLTDGHAMAIGQYELLQKIKDHLASKPPEDYQP
jgi:predicted RNase H-like nuclease (RuvC/YqgF family)